MCVYTYEYFLPSTYPGWAFFELLTDRGGILILLTFLESLVIALINMVTILMMSAKVTTPGFLKIRVF